MGGRIAQLVEQLTLKVSIVERLFFSQRVTSLAQIKNARSAATATGRTIPEEVCSASSFPTVSRIRVSPSPHSRCTKGLLRTRLGLNKAASTSAPLSLSAAQTDPLRHFNISQGDRLDRHDEPSSPTIACCILRLPVLAPAASKIRICNNDALRAFNCNRICFCCSRSGTSGDRYGDLFQQAVNYVFTGRLDPSDGPQIVDRDSCIVVVPEPKFNRYARYYLIRFKMDTARISKIYAGAQTLYELEVEGDDIIFEYLKADRTTVDYGFTSAQIPLPGEIGPTKKALALISSQFCRLDKPKIPF